MPRHSSDGIELEQKLSSSKLQLLTNRLNSLSTSSKYFIFRGVVAVSMSLMSLDINQCNQEYHVPNAFKNTDKCDKQTTYVSINNIKTIF